MIHSRKRNKPVEKGINEKKRVSGEIGIETHTHTEDRERSWKSAEVLETLTSDEARRAVHPEPEIVLA